jgi:hypothetical protein
MVCAAASGVLGIAAMVSPQPGVSLTSHRTAIVRRHQVAIAETSSMNALMDQVNTVGITKFPHSYEGVRALSRYELVVYAVLGHAQLSRALSTMPHHGITIRIQVVKRSYQQLEDLTLRIARDRRALAAGGISLQSWAPDPTSDTVLVTLAGPTGAASPKILGTARNVLQAEFGRSWITVSPIRLPLAVVASAARDYDASPVSAGDYVYYSTPGNYCTDAFGTTANGGKHHTYILSAGHCGKGPVADSYNGLAIGSVATQYLDALNGDELDFETIKASVSASGKVWYGDTGTSGDYHVSGPTTPAAGTTMTFDGDAAGDGQVTGVLVGMSNGCVTVSDETYGTYEVCDAGSGSLNASNGIKVCISGDSGGPTYVRTTYPNVDAAGTIFALSNNGYVCYFQEITKELTAANLKLITS